MDYKVLAIFVIQASFTSFIIQKIAVMNVAATDAGVLQTMKKTGVKLDTEAYKFHMN